MIGVDPEARVNPEMREGKAGDLNRKYTSDERRQSLPVNLNARVFNRCRQPIQNNDDKDNDKKKEIQDNAR